MRKFIRGIVLTILALCVFAVPANALAQDSSGTPMTVDVQMDGAEGLNYTTVTYYLNVCTGEVVNEGELNVMAAALQQGFVKLDVGLRNDNGYVGVAFLASGINRVKIKGIKGTGVLRDRSNGSGNEVNYNKSTIVPSTYFTLLKPTNRKIVSGHRYTFSFTLTVDSVSSVNGFSGVTNPTTL